MSIVLGHRGTDDDGIYTSSGVSLGHRRLSIIDLEGGHQPITNEDGDVVVCANGEIYNHQRLRAQLEKQGHSFSTDSDTEVIAHGYEEDGPAFFGKLNGMFAVAVWDEGTGSLVLARDRLGIKPLYYTRVGDKLLFASEIKALLQYEGVPRRPDMQALAHFMTFRYTPSAQTMFDTIHEVPPGHVFVVRNGRIAKTIRYWELDEVFSGTTSSATSPKEMRGILTEAVRLRLMSDVPLGVFLSGGIDSSIIVGLMSEMIDEPISTFSVAFDAEEPINEARFAQLVADRFGTNHHVLTVEPNSIDLLPTTIWHLDNPVSDPTIIPEYLISELGRKHVKTVLTGEGADEIFGGYMQYKVMCLGERYSRLLPPRLRRLVARTALASIPDALLDRLFPYATALGTKGRERALSYLENIEDRARTFVTLRSFFSEDEKAELYSPELHDTEVRQQGYIPEMEPFFSNGGTRSLLDRLILIDLERRLPHFILHKTDKMMMAHALEGRFPFLDHRLVEYSFKIPSDMKLRGTTEKYILRQAFSDILPPEIRKRRKHPFIVPMKSWIDENLKGLIPSIIEGSPICRGTFLRKRTIDRIVRDFDSSPLYYGRQLWSILTLAIWHRIYIESDDITRPQLDLERLF